MSEFRFSPDTFHLQGFSLLEGAIPTSLLERFREEADRLLAESREKGGARNILARSPLLRRFACEEVPQSVARQLLGEQARPVKLTLFDKTQGANWKVPWHQDLTIAVRERCEVPGFGPWSLKGGVHHVQPPVEILENLLAIRIHLDDTPEDHGALRVIPGSHLLGRLTDSEIDDATAGNREVRCPLAAGGMMLLRPLLVHASSPCRRPHHRRVVHIEYSAIELPGELGWVEIRDQGDHAPPPPK